MLVSHAIRRNGACVDNGCNTGYNSRSLVVNPHWINVFNYEKIWCDYLQLYDISESKTMHEGLLLIDMT